MLQINSVFFKDIRKEIEKFFQASVVEIKTQATKSKTFYKNISGNYKNIIGRIKENNYIAYCCILTHEELEFGV